jgi:hypothetical protein
VARQGRILVATGEMFCPLCGMLVSRVGTSPVAHDAPCGRICVAGGVALYTYMLAAIHRGRDCEMCEWDEGEE